MCILRNRTKHRNEKYRHHTTSSEQSAVALWHIHTKCNVSPVHALEGAWDHQRRKSTPGHRAWGNQFRKVTECIRAFVFPGRGSDLRMEGETLRTRHRMVGSPSLWCASKRWHPENPAHPQPQQMPRNMSLSPRPTEAQDT